MAAALNGGKNVKAKQFDKQAFIKEVKDNAKQMFRKTVDEITEEQMFQAVALTVKEEIIDDWIDTHKTYEKQDAKILYYLSMEFLMGRALGNMIINICARDEIREALEEMNFDLNAIEDREPDPALGNGGLGRLAACFLDSLATLGYGAYGCGIRYRYGMFAQKIVGGCQREVPDDWLRNGNPFEIRRPEYACEVTFGGRVVMTTDSTGRNHFSLSDYRSVRAVPYDLPVVGYGSGVVNTLRIWDAEPLNTFNLDSFDRGDYAKAVEQENLARNIVEVLYPNDNHYAGKELRLKQQYFFISATLQTAIRKYKETHGGSLKGFCEKVVFQMNDTHPTLTVAELMRILLDEENYEWDEAWAVVTRCCAYTNHTIMSEALEKWPIDLFQKLLPRVYMIVDEINRRFVESLRRIYPGDEAKIAHMAPLYGGQVRMAYLAIVGSFSVNGVARLHTEILKKQELRDFYELWPGKFHNMTNGITQRRFLLHGNPLLSDFVTKRIGDDWITDLSKIAELKKYLDDPESLREFGEIKHRNKVRLAAYVKEKNGIEIDPDSIFDIQVKRLHEYKRQLLNILHVMYLYDRMKADPAFLENFYPRTFIFGGKAAAGYARAKDTIRLINAVADRVNSDASLKGKMKVVFIEDYKVSNAELLFAAADISEQISTASKEASGTGNMKFMLNGAPTLGTMDGANVEIVEEVGIENAFIFGLSSEEVIAYEGNGGYRPEQIFAEDGELREVIMKLRNGFYSPDEPERFRGLYDSLIPSEPGEKADVYFILKDFRSYHEASMRASEVYRDREKWLRMSMLQTAGCGKFSSDRTVREYISEIWHLDPLKK